MELSHIVVRIPGDPFGDQSDRVLEGHGKVPAVAMRFQAAGLDHALGFEHRAGHGKPLLPMAPGDLLPFPTVGIQIIKDHDVKAQLLSQVKNALALHRRSRVAHPAAVAHRDPARAHRL